MQVRNPIYNSVGTVDLEIEHVTYGWIPFTASPNDAAGAELYAQALAGGFGPVGPYVAPSVVPPTPAQTEALRSAAYRTESDPIFFKAQRGEAAMSDWLAKVAEIKARYP